MRFRFVVESPKEDEEVIEREGTLITPEYGACIDYSVGEDLYLNITSQSLAEKDVDYLIDFLKAVKKEL